MQLSVFCLFYGSLILSDKKKSSFGIDQWWILRGSGAPHPLFWVKKEGRKASRASKTKPGPLLSSRSGSAIVDNPPDLGWHLWDLTMCIHVLCYWWMVPTLSQYIIMICSNSIHISFIHLQGKKISSSKIFSWKRSQENFSKSAVCFWVLFKVVLTFSFC